MSFLLSRIQRTNGQYTTGLEVHETLDSARLSFWARMKLAYGKSENDFVSCKIIDEERGILPDYNMTWIREGVEEPNRYFLHHIRKNNGVYDDKAIDDLGSLETAYGNLAALMEYGNSNPKFPNVSLVYCLITDLLSGGMVLESREWHKVEEPTTEPEPEPEATE